jgi:uncharacterized protein (TIGR01777 family)
MNPTNPSDPTRLRPRVVVTGATGFVGRALCLRLAADGAQIVALARSPDAARAKLGAEAEIVADDGRIETLVQAVDGADAVVHLAGEPVFGGRWTAARKARLRSSRIDYGQRLVAALEKAERRPSVFVSASAVGYYGDRGDEVLPEETSPGSDFLAELCRDWEASTEGVSALGIRRVVFRLGVVLGREGGALAQMLLPFSFGLGGRIGSGKQWMPWVHLQDLVGMIRAAVRDAGWSGIYNGTAPNPVRNVDFTRALGRTLRRPTPFPVPGFGLKLVFGGAADVLLGGQRTSSRVESAGYAFEFPTLEAALADVVGAVPDLVLEPAQSWPEVPYLSGRRPRYHLRQTTVLDAPLEQVFAFFSRPENLGALTPGSMRFEIRTPPPIEMKEGAELEYAIGLGPVPMRWHSRIDEWKAGERFADAQLSGPYAVWYHVHRYERLGERTRMTDEVWYAPPLGPLGRIGQALIVGPMLRRLFGFRASAVRLRFPGRPARARQAA